MTDYYGSYEADYDEWVLQRLAEHDATDVRVSPASRAESMGSGSDSGAITGQGRTGFESPAESDYDASLAGDTRTSVEPLPEIVWSPEARLMQVALLCQEAHASVHLAEKMMAAVLRGE